MKAKLPKNMCLVGQAGYDKKVFIEEYVISYLEKIVKNEKEPQIIVFFGDGYAKEGIRYYFLKGAASHRASGNCLKKIDEFYFQTIGKQYYPQLKGIGWYYMEKGYGEMLDLLQNMQEQDFYDIKGYYVYFEKNTGMEEYMTSRQSGREGDADARQTRPVKKGKGKRAAAISRPSFWIPYLLAKRQTRIPGHRKAAPMLAVQVLNMVSLCILIICCIIAVTTLNQYDKMKELEETVIYLEASLEEQKNLPEE